GGGPRPAPAGPEPAAAGPLAAAPLLPLTLLLAFAGGLLLNLMPCVFPVLSLKVLGLASHGGHRRSLVAGGLAYTAGVVLSFGVLAALLLGLRAGGAELGWGFQLQSPGFVAALALLFTLIGLNLLGVIGLAGVLPQKLCSMHAKQPLLEHALTGVLAALIASPCTAPFMGAALGVALTLAPAAALSVFIALGLGMAAPYLVVSCWPRLARALPRPGAWMEQLKIALAFPMFGTVVWLLWVFGQQVGLDGAAALLGLLVGLAFVVWAWAAAALARRTRRVLGTFALLLLGAGLLAAWPALRATPAPVAGTPATGGSAASSPWQPWSPAAVAQAQAEGRPVLVDFTAAWCVTCQFNKHGTLADAKLLAELASRRVLLLRADWTRRDASITQALAALGRNGVPVYALYAPGATTPTLLPEILSTSAVRSAMARWPAPQVSAAPAGPVR
ncbi:MAG: thioredoxin family protein, partial [Burkholderiales bacterium]|nr:thioredoxin family protein [Burkholderiales bacterium]